MRRISLFAWKERIGITDIEFLESPNLGEPYDNDMFVGDYHNGNLYHFELTSNRSAIDLGHHSLDDTLVDNNEELTSIIFGKGFAGITDIETGPDVILYILSYGDGTLYRIIPKHNSSSPHINILIDP